MARVKLFLTQVMVKFLRLIWDFLLGVLLIGGLPWCLIAIPIIIGDYLLPAVHVTTPDVVTAVVSVASFLGAVVAFGWAIWFRSKKRLLPFGFLILEAGTGFFGAVVLFFVFGMLERTIID